MNPELRELYQQVILDHYRNPRNRGKVESANRHADGVNPLCGDKISIHLKIENDTVQDIGFQGSGCAISTASASMMTDALKGKKKQEAEAMFKEFHELVTEEKPSKPHCPSLGKLAIFEGVREFPMRVKCASLAWHTMHSALNNHKDPVTTE